MFKFLLLRLDCSYNVYVFHYDREISLEIACLVNYTRNYLHIGSISLTFHPPRGVRCLWSRRLAMRPDSVKQRVHAYPTDDPTFRPD
jgi:hypothetical protein